MKKKLTKYGNSTALIIDKPLLKLLNLDASSEVEISVEKGKLIIRPSENKQKSRSSSEIKKIAREIMDEYSDVFKKLAE